MTFAEYLDENDITDAEAAVLYGRDRSMISRMRRGINRPSYECMIDIARLTKGAVSVDSWLGPVAKKKRAKV